MKNSIQPKLHVKQGDSVKVLSGNSKGKVGTVIQVYPKQRKASVEGVHLLTHYLRPNKKEPNKTGLIKKEAPLPVSKLMVIDPATNQPTRIGRKLNNKGKQQRYSKKTGNFI